MKTKKIISVIVLVIMFSLMMALKADAASVSIYANNNEVTVGTKVTITVSGNAAAWDLKISGTGISTTPIVGYTSDAENGSFSKTISFTPNSTGKYMINLNGNITDESNSESTKVNKSINITVKAKSSGGGSSSGESGSSGSGSSSSGSGSNGSGSSSNAPSFTEVNETVYATDSVNVRSSYSTSSNVIGSLEKGDSVTRIGKSSSWSKVKYNGQTAYISSDYLTTKKPEEEKKSNNKNLKSLEVENYKLTPDFSKDITEYDLKVTEDVDKLNIKAVPEDEKAKVEIKGADKLLTGVNTIEIKVTAEDKTVRTYKINVTKGDIAEEETGLSEMTVEGYTLTPEFSSNVHEYTLNIADPSVTSLNIDTKAFEENAKVEISGNDELKLGENIVTILVTSEDEKNTYTYQIVVNITEKTEENNQIIAGIDNSDLYMYIGIGVAVLVVIIIIIVIVKRRNKDDDDFAPYYGRFDSLNNNKNDSKEDNIKDNLSGTLDTKYSEKDNSQMNNNSNMVNDLSSDVKNDNINNTVENDTKQDRKSVIEENFGTGIGFNDFNSVEYDRPRRKKGKHSK